MDTRGVHTRPVGRTGHLPAARWIVVETLNVAWPRMQPDQPWYINWSRVITTAVLGVVGAVIYLRVRRNAEPLADRLQHEAQARS